MKKIFSVLVVAFFLATTFVLIPQNNYFALADDEVVTDASSDSVAAEPKIKADALLRHSGAGGHGPPPSPLCQGRQINGRFVFCPGGGCCNLRSKSCVPSCPSGTACLDQVCR